MVNLYEVIEFLNSAIMVDQIAGDSSNNGLQIEGKNEIKKIVFGVDMSETLANIAVELGADMIFTHHGISWGSSLKYISNYNARLIRPLMKNDISLFSVHLPLDGNPDFGHNVLLANMLKLDDQEDFSMYGGAAIGVKGVLPMPMTADEIGSLLSGELDSIVKSYAGSCVEPDFEDSCMIIGGSNQVQNIGIVSGGGGMSCIHDAIEDGLDCVITGELEHTMYHLAKENGISVIAPGHYRTEVPGVVAVMDLIKETFDIETEFVHIPTGL